MSKLDYVHLPPYRVDLQHVPHSEKDGVDWALTSYSIPDLWQRTKGEGVTVAVIDSGVAPHYALENVVDRRNFSSDSEVYDTLGHGCISPDDEVYTSAGGVQPIRDLFDSVSGVTHFLEDGSIVKDVSNLGIYTLGYDPNTQATVRRKVLAVHKLAFVGEAVRVSTREGSLSFTPWHPVYVQTSQRGGDRSAVKKRADELEVGDRLVASRPNEGVRSGYHVMPLSPRWVCVHCGHSARACRRKQCKKCNKLHWHNGPTERGIPLDEDMAFFLGLIASDGHVLRSGKTLSFHNNNRLLADVFDGLCQRLFGKRSCERPASARSPSLIEQRLHSTDAWDICVRHMQMPHNKSRTLEFPRLVLRSNPSVILAFIAGVIEGDGSVCKKTGRIRVTTGSERFAKQLVSIMRFLGIGSSYHALVPSATGFATTKPSWHVRIASNKALAEKLVVKRLACEAKARERRAVGVTDITREPYDGPMYDLTVDGSHNYAANGVIVSNTHVAGVIGATKGPAKGIAPGCKIISLKVLGHSGMGSNDAVATAVRFAAEADVDLICMSLGSPGPSANVHQAIQYATGKGVVCICAAGNDGGAVNFPAAFHETVAVGAVDKHGNVCDFSSRGREIVVAAPGQDITSTWLADGYATISGTSMAAPFVAGVLALYLSHHGPATHADIMAALSESARDAGPPGHDHTYGWGLMDPARLLGPQVKAQSAEDGVTIFIPGARIL